MDMNLKYVMNIDATKPNDNLLNNLTDAVRLCETVNRIICKVIVLNKEDINSVLDCLYDLVKDSDYTVSEFVSAKPNRISFITGSYIYVENVKIS